jgi:hypothetical protein
MPLQRLTPDRLSCFAIGFPLLGITLYPQAPFAIAKVSPCWISLCTLRPLSQLLRFLPVGYHSVPSDPSCTLRSCRYRYTSPAFQQDKLTRAFLISQQAVPYRTRGGTCCPGGSTPETWSLADSSMTSHITWRNPTVSTSPTLLKPQHRSSPWSSHISMDGRPNTLTKTQAKLNITKNGKTCTTLMTAWLSMSTQYNPNPKVWGLGTVLNHASQCVY